MNFAVGAIESCLPMAARYLPAQSIYTALRRVFNQHPTIEKVLGFVWVFLFFFWSVPKWQYPHNFDFLKQLGR